MSGVRTRRQVLAIDRFLPRSPGNRRVEHRTAAVAEPSSNGAPKSSARVGERARSVAWRDDDAAVCSGDQGLICKIVLKPTSVGDALTTRRCYVGEAEDPARSCRLLHACTPGPNRIGSFLDNFHCPCLNFVEIVETAAFPYEKHTLTSSNVLSIQFFIYLLYIF